MTGYEGDYSFLSHMHVYLIVSYRHQMHVYLIVSYRHQMHVCLIVSYRHQMSKLKLELEGVPKLRAFSQWMCCDKGAKFKQYDVNKGGSIDLEELELALEEYFDSVCDTHSC